MKVRLEQIICTCERVSRYLVTPSRREFVHLRSCKLESHPDARPLEPATFINDKHLSTTIASRARISCSCATSRVIRCRIIFMQEQPHFRFLNRKLACQLACQLACLDAAFPPMWVREAVARGNKTDCLPLPLDYL